VDGMMLAKTVICLQTKALLEKRGIKVDDVQLLTSLDPIIDKIQARVELYLGDNISWATLPPLSFDDFVQPLDFFVERFMLPAAVAASLRLNVERHDVNISEAQKAP